MKYKRWGKLSENHVKPQQDNDPKETLTDCIWPRHDATGPLDVP